MTTSRSHFFAPTKFFVLSVLVLVAAFSLADASTLAKTYVSKQPGTQPRGTEYVVSSFCSDETNDEPEEPVAFVAKKRHTSPLKAAYQWYLKSCTETPFRAKGLTSATIAALGDVIAQLIEKKATAKALNAARVATFFFVNMLFTGPFIHLWYTFLNTVGKKMDERFYNVSALKKTVTQVFLDQTLGTAVFFPLYIYVYGAFESVIQMHRLPNLSHATEKCRNHLWGIIMTQFRVFPLSNMINFGLVPFELRVLWTSTVSLFWNIYLCSVVGTR